MSHWSNPEALGDPKVDCITVGLDIFGVPQGQDSIVFRARNLSMDKIPLLEINFFFYCSLHCLSTVQVILQGNISHLYRNFGFQSTFTYTILFRKSEKLYNIGRAGCDFNPILQRRNLGLRAIRWFPQGLSQGQNPSLVLFCYTMYCSGSVILMFNFRFPCQLQQGNVSIMSVGQVEEEDQVGGPQSDWIMLWHSGTSAREKTKRRLLICVWNGLRAFVYCIHLFCFLRVWLGLGPRSESLVLRTLSPTQSFSIFRLEDGFLDSFTNAEVFTLQAGGCFSNSRKNQEWSCDNTQLYFSTH